MKRIIIYPSINSKTNRYINDLYNTIKDEFDVIGYDNKNIDLMIKSDIIHFNWIESFNNNKEYLKHKLLIIILKLLNKKIIWTVHNNMPHDSNNKNKTIRFMKFMAKKSDRIHILCKETLQNDYLKKYTKKIIYIPHGDYIGNYPKCDLDIYNKYNIEKNKKIIFFVGQVRKYKNIELIIDSFKESKLEDQDFVLLICGKASNKEYEQELLKKGNNNIFFDFNFVKDEEMEAYLRQSKFIIAPYDKTSSLNSGTLWMAMSYKKTMILPLIGCVKDIKNYDDFLYVYDYKEKEDHYNKLLDCLKKIKNDISNNEKVIDEKGIEAYNYILNNQSWEKNKENWINLYKF